MLMKPRPESPAPDGIVLDQSMLGDIAILKPANNPNAPPLLLPADAAFAMFEPINPPEFPA